MEKYILRKNGTEVVNSFYQFFSNPGIELKKLITEHEDFGCLYQQHFGGLIPLNPGNFLSLYDYLTMGQKNIVCHYIDRKTYENSYGSAHKMYQKEITVLQAFFAFVNGWEWADFRKISENCFELKIAFEKVYKENLVKRNLEGIHRSQILGVYLRATPENKAFLVNMALDKYSRNYSESIINEVLY